MLQNAVAACINLVLEEARSHAGRKKSGGKKGSNKQQELEVEPEADRSETKVPAGFSDEDVTNLETITALLDPLADLTDKWQGDRVTSSIVIPGLIYAISGK